MVDVCWRRIILKAPLMKFCLIFMLLGLPSICFSGNVQLKILGSAGYNKILFENTGKEFTLIFWSVTCPPCIKELALISKNKMYLNQKFVFVSTDSEQSSQDVIALLKKLALEDQDHWIFQNGQAQAIISSVDDNWYGEVPRNYFFDEDHNRMRLRKIE